MKLRAISVMKLDQETVLKIREWRNQDFIRINMIQTHLITEEEHLRFIERVKQDPSRGLYVFYLDDEPIGVYQYIRDFSNNTIENGNYLISQDYQAMGYGILMYCLIDYIVFEHLRVDVAYADILSYNNQAMSLQKKFKSKLSEIKHGAICIDGVEQDLYRFMFTREEYEANMVSNNGLQGIFNVLIDNEPMEDMIIE